VQRQRLINDNQLALWTTLRETAKAAVLDINTAQEKLLFFADSDFGEPQGFQISFSPGTGEQRVVRVTFDPSAHSVSIRPPRGSARVLNIAARANQVHLVDPPPSTTVHPVEDIVKYVLSVLQKG
jgi:hypothetical protein